VSGCTVTVERSAEEGASFVVPTTAELGRELALQAAQRASDADVDGGSSRDGDVISAPPQLRHVVGIVVT